VSEQYIDSTMHGATIKVRKLYVKNVGKQIESAVINTKCTLTLV